MSFTCQTCNCSFARQLHLDRHYQSRKHEIRSNATESSLFKCILCSRTFVHASGLSKHRKVCNQTMQQQLADIQNTIDTEREQHQQEKEKCEKESGLIDLDERLSKTEALIAQQAKSILNLEAKIKRQPTIIYQDNKRCKIPDQVRLDICTKQNGQCNGCDQVLGDFFQLDHIVALRFGGTSDISNLQALCGQCHNEKSALESIHRLEIQEAVSTILEKHKDSRRLTMATS
jgi:5-methylcytosine-specific restriction protein A